MTTNRFTLARPIALCLALALVGFGCSSLNNTEKGAVIGGTAGTAVGAGIGKILGGTAEGAIAGAVIGGTAGAIIGRQMDKQAEEIEEEIPDAEVTRVTGENGEEGGGILVTFDSGILFAVNSSNLQPEARANLRSLANSLQEYSNTELTIVGHTDSSGRDEYNMTLSQQRADAARAYLLEQGVSPSRITTIGKGEMEPVADNTTATGRQANRRVEVAIYASEAFREEAVQQSSGR